jgi:hypothetical protein
VCKGSHTAWSNACPARKKELGRVEQAKLARSVYWYVPAGENNGHSRSDNVPNNGLIQDGVPATAPAPNQITTQRPERQLRPSATQSTGGAPHPRNPAPNLPAEPASVLSIEPAEASREPQMPVDVPTMRMTETGPAEEEWATPATQQDITQQQSDIPVDPRLGGMEEDLSTIRVQVDGPLNPYTYPLDGLEGGAPMTDANMWLDSVFDGSGDNWLRRTQSKCHLRLPRKLPNLTQPKGESSKVASVLNIKRSTTTGLHAMLN